MEEGGKSRICWVLVCLYLFVAFWSCMRTFLVVLCRLLTSYVGGGNTNLSLLCVHHSFLNPPGPPPPPPRPPNSRSYRAITLSPESFSRKCREIFNICFLICGSPVLSLPSRESGLVAFRSVCEMRLIFLCFSYILFLT